MIFPVHPRYAILDKLGYPIDEHIFEILAKLICKLNFQKNNFGILLDLMATKIKPKIRLTT